MRLVFIYIFVFGQKSLTISSHKIQFHICFQKDFKNCKKNSTNHFSDFSAIWKHFGKVHLKTHNRDNQIMWLLLLLHLLLLLLIEQPLDDGALVGINFKYVHEWHLDGKYSPFVSFFLVFIKLNWGLVLQVNKLGNLNFFS